MFSNAFILILELKNDQRFNFFFFFKNRQIQIKYYY